jgi:pimeloyl-ACP methyl ester carboxylesterase
MRILQLPIGNLTFDALASGPEDGPLVLLLHGFPQTALAFHEVLPRLGAAGLHAVAVTQRGYSPGARTDDVAGYEPAALADDVLGMADALGTQRFHVVGHDLGALVTWQLATGVRGGRVASATALSVPHPAAYGAALLRSTQLLRSAYVPVFQLPVVPQTVLGARGGLALGVLLRRTGLSADLAETYVRHLVDGGGLRYALHWYRALRRHGSLLSLPSATIPTTFVWSDGDVALDRAGATRAADHVEADYRFEVLEGVSHWIPEEAADAVADLVIDRVVRS